MQESEPTATRSSATLSADALGGKEVRHWLMLHHGTRMISLELEDGCDIVIGRSSAATLIIDDLSVSRAHARIQRSADRVTVEDLGSSNGTLLSGQPLDAPSAVMPGDEMAFGDARAWVLVASPRHGFLEGIETHGAFLRLVDMELTRARTFDRDAALLIVGAHGSPGALLPHTVPRLRRLLRPVDRIGLFSHRMLELLLPEAGAAEAREVAKVIVGERQPLEPLLRVGIATYGALSATPEALLADGLESLRLASRQEPVGPSREQSTADPQRPSTADAVAPVIGCDAMRVVYEMAQRIAHSSLPVLLHGETGVGKELVAQAVHHGGPRKHRPFVSVNCGAIPESLLPTILFGHEPGAFTGAEERRIGLFEAAHTGTIFLDEIGELPLRAQAALLRVLEAQTFMRVGSPQEVHVDVRVLAATHRSLEALCEEGLFRTDLLFRLNAVVLEVPPLRARREEIVPLARHFLGRMGERYSTTASDFTTDAVASLLSHDWPGNVRELRNVVEYAALNAHGELVSAAHLQDRLSPDRAPRAVGGERVDDAQEPSFKDRVQQFEQELIQAALGRTSGNRTAAARLLKMPLRTLTHKLKQLSDASGEE